MEYREGADAGDTARLSWRHDRESQDREGRKRRYEPAQQRRPHEEDVSRPGNPELRPGGVGRQDDGQREEKRRQRDGREDERPWSGTPGLLHRFGRKRPRPMGSRKA